MKLKTQWGVACSCLLAVGLAALVIDNGFPAKVSSAPSGRTKLPLYFIENHGQVDERVSYYLSGGNATVYFKQTSVLFALSNSRTNQGSHFVQASNAPGAQPSGWAVELNFVGANSTTQPLGERRTPAQISYFVGPEENWMTGIPAYAGITYSEVWPGVNLNYTGTGGRLKYTFRVSPGADPNQIRLSYRGASSVTLNERGRLEVATPVGSFVEDKPYVYQDRDGRRVEVASEYQLDGATFGFRLGNYDHSLPLLIDPAILVYSGYIGGVQATAGGRDVGIEIAVDLAGNAYIVGDTNAVDFPTTEGAYWPPPKPGGVMDTFVAKVSANGDSLIYATYLGSAGEDHVYGIAVDLAGNAYITGSTNSSAFPATAGPPCHAGAMDAFVTKLNPQGTALVYSRCIGGSGADKAQGIAVDLLGQAYVTGETKSLDFPVTPAWLTPSLNGGEDAFLVKISAPGDSLLYARYLGGSDGACWPGEASPCGEYPYAGIALDLLGNAYISGKTASRDFPVTAGWPYPQYSGGIADSFVTKVDPSGAVVYSGYLGGTGEDEARGIAVSLLGEAFVTGWTSSTDFPVRPNWLDQDYNGGVRDVFVTKVNWMGTRLMYSGYLGGSASDYANDITVDLLGNAYITGATMSSDFPVTTGMGPEFQYKGPADATDVFFAKINHSGRKLFYAGYLGGQLPDTTGSPVASEFGNGISLDLCGNFYLTGYTESTDFPRVGMGSSFLLNRPKADAFITKIAQTYDEED